MTLRTYQAPTMAEALAKVKKDLGKDAVILHTRSFKKGQILGFFGRPQVEITASVGVNVMGPREMRSRSDASPALPQTPTAPASQSGLQQKSVAAPSGQSVLERAYGIPAAATQPAPRTALAPDLSTQVTVPPTPTPAQIASVTQANTVGSRGMSSDLREELAAIKVMVGQVLQSSAHVAANGLTQCSPVSPAMPAALLNLYLKLIQSDVAREIADKVAADIRDELSPAELADPEIVRQSMLRRIEALIPAESGLAPPTRHADGRPQTIALIGPTGVGKTTTIAKLAASYRLRHGRKIGLVTADTFRIAAVDQLRTYANIIGVPLKVALTPDEMSQCCESMSEMDAILIDTAGRSPGDDQRLDELAATLAAARPHQTHLVLASVCGEASLLRTLERFAPMNPTRIIFTKLDEAAGFGVLLNVLGRTTAKLSFVTTGQEVPDDIEPGRPDRLARLVLDGSATRGGNARP